MAEHRDFSPIPVQQGFGARMTERGRGPAFVGFYWTLPVPRFGITGLPRNVDKAAAASRTIRYQREVVKRYATLDCRGYVAGEVVWMEHEPDRGSPYVREPLEEAFSLCRSKRATLLYVDFALRQTHDDADTYQRWRRHAPLREALKNAPVDCEPLPPDSIRIDGKLFDPIEHFRAWRKLLAERRYARHRKEEYAKEIITLIAPYIPPQQPKPDYKAAARFLNEQKLQTTTGKLWSADTLRMFANKYVLGAAE